MNANQKSELKSAISDLVTASEELGSITGSFGWNEKYFKQRAARDKVNALIDEIAASPDNNTV